MFYIQFDGIIALRCEMTELLLDSDSFGVYHVILISLHQ